ncbi:type IV secretion system DNA-binding domain-containing protein [Candidatus Uhrbacteria bacterium]|nr:type IV secretion system DNA-binding domain-containing protein [Candidatus Uhrbacteria bacterium]
MSGFPHDHENEVNPFAQTNFRGKTQQFGIKTDDRRRHMYLIGKTGMGKTSMLEHLIIHDIKMGHGVAYLDPHGDTAQKILDFIPSYRVNDVIYFNPADLSWPVAFNVLEHVDRNQQHLVASGLIGIFKKIWSDSWGPRLEYVLRNAILALMDYPGTTLLGIMRILVDKEYRRKVVSKVQDPVVKSFWVDEYSRYPDKFQTEAIAPIQNKVGQFLSSPLVRNIVGQVKSTIDIQQIMDEEKILIMNLAKGGVGEDNSALLGAMMVTKLYLGAMGRVRIPEKERKDFYLYVDEFQNFATDSFADILSEARKYRLNLIIAHQYIGQLMTDTSTRVRDAVYGNVGTIVSFRVGATDAEFLEPEFMPIFTQEDLVNLPKWEVYLKLMINGVASDPFSAHTLPPIDVLHQLIGSTEKTMRVSRERYARPREEIENKIGRWTGMLGADEDDEAAPELPEGGWQHARAEARSLTEGMTGAPRPDRRAPPPRPSPARPMPTAPPRAPEERRPAPPPASSAGGWLREARRSASPPTGDAEAQSTGAQRPDRPPPEPRQAECAKCGGMATVFFRPRPGQRILCENCMRAEKERTKMAAYEKPRGGAVSSAVGDRRSAGDGMGRQGAPGGAPRPDGPRRGARGGSRGEVPQQGSGRGRGSEPRRSLPPVPSIDRMQSVERPPAGKELSLGEVLRAAQEEAARRATSNPPSGDGDDAGEEDSGNEQ